MRLRRILLVLIVLLLGFLFFAAGYTGGPPAAYAALRWQQIAAALSTVRWAWLGAAALLDGLAFVALAGLYAAALRAVEVSADIRALLPAVLAALPGGLSAALEPFGEAAEGKNASGDEAARLAAQDNPDLPAKSRAEAASATAAAARVIAVTAMAAALLVLLLGGTVYLLTHHALAWHARIGAALLLAILGGFTALLLVGLWYPHRLAWWLERSAKKEQAGSPGRADQSRLLPFGDPFALTGASLAVTARPGEFGRALLAGLLWRALDLGVLACVVAAFDLPAPGRIPLTGGVMIIAYGLAVLVQAVGLTPYGVPLAEAALALGLWWLSMIGPSILLEPASLTGIPLETAVFIALAYRALTTYLPLLLGGALRARMPRFNPRARPLSDAWGVTLLAVLTALMGLVNVYSAIVPTAPARLAPLVARSPLHVIHGGRLTAALSGFALLVLANQIRRRKRVAWFLVIFILIVSAASHLIKGLNVEEAVLALALAAWLFYLRPHFHALTDPPSVRQGIVALVAATAFTLAYGAAGFYLLDRHFKFHFGLYDALAQTVVMFTGFYDPGLMPIPVTRLGRYFADSIYLIAFATFAYAAIMLVRPLLLRRPASADERARAGEIVTRWGCDSLAPFALLADKSCFFSPGGSLIAYVVEGRVALALGDPIGPPGDFAAALEAFRQFCARADWLPAFYQVSPAGLPVYHKAGLDALRVGQEAVVDLLNFSLEGPANKPMRNAYNKIKKLGYRAEVVQPPLPDPLLRELREISNAWLTLVHGSEKRFSLGWFYEDYVRRWPVLVVRDAAGNGLAFANILRAGQPRQSGMAVLDLMRHRPEAESGVMDFLFISLLTWAREQKYECFDIGLSALAGVGEGPRDSTIERALHYIYEHVERFYNFKGLHHYKEKFHPRWEDRYLIYPGASSLLMVTLAMMRADSGDNWLSGYLKK